MVTVLALSVPLVTIWIWWEPGGWILGATIAVGIVSWGSILALKTPTTEAAFETAFLREISGGAWDTSLEEIKASPFASGVYMITLLTQTGLLAWGVSRDPSVTWWQAPAAVIILAVCLFITKGKILKWIFFLVVGAWLIRFCGVDL